MRLLRARYAEYAGWMWQESGNDGAALWWTDKAVEMRLPRVIATWRLTRWFDVPS